MGGPIPNFVPGEPAFPALNADVLNTMKAGIFGGLQKRPRHHVPEVTTNHRLECYVKNGTSADYPIHSIMAVNGTASSSLPLTSAAEKIYFNDTPVFTVNVPVLATDFPFVLIEPLPANGFAKAAIGGIVVCTVNITDAGHEYANPTAGDHTKMTSGATGQCRILHKPTGTGNKVCAVYLVEPSAPAGSGGGFTIYESTPYSADEVTGPPCPAGQTITGMFWMTCALTAAGATNSWQGYTVLRRDDTGVQIGGAGAGIYDGGFVYSLPMCLEGSFGMTNSTGSTVQTILKFFRSGGSGNLMGSGHYLYTIS